MAKRILNFIQAHPITSIICYSILLRLVVQLLYDGVSIYPDSSGYIELAKQISNLDLSNHLGKRTPGYPVLIALVGNKLIWVTLLQSCLGIFNTYVFYKLIFHQLKNINAALLTAVIFTSFMDVIFYEVAILTETLSLSFVLLSFWLIQKYKALEPNVTFKHLLILSILFGYSYLVRPMFIYIPLFFCAFFILKNFKFHFRASMIKGCTIIIIPMALFYGWSTLNKKTIDVFGSTYFLGFNLSQTATSFFDKAPDEESLIRDVFVKHRDSVVLHGTKHEYPMVVWRAYDELIEKTELTPVQLSQKLGDISINLFKTYPHLYLKQVGISWIGFWGKSILWKPKQIKSELVKNIFMGSWLFIQQWLGLVINLIFISIGFFKIFQFCKRKFSGFDFELLVIGTVLLGSLAQAMIAYGSNSRFSFPFFPLIIYIVSTNIFNFIKSYATNSST